MLLKLKNNVMKDISLLSYEETLEQIRFLKNKKRIKSNENDENKIKLLEIKEKYEKLALIINKMEREVSLEDIKIRDIDKILVILNKNKVSEEKFNKVWEHFEECQTCE